MNTIQERVIHHLDPSNASTSHIPLFLPCIRIFRGGGNNDDYNDDYNDDDDLIRPFTQADLDRVMDYNNMPHEPPAPCAMMHCEAPGSGIENNDNDGELEVYDGGISFPKRWAKLAGGYIFLTANSKIGGKDKNADGGNKEEESKRNTTTAGDHDGESISGKIACIPLQGCTVELPPGGRRVFREHAHTGARKGYEMAIHVRHSSNNNNDNNSNGNNNDNAKMTCYIILDTLGHRESWASAIRLRCDMGQSKVTILRPGGIAGSRLMSVENDAYYGDGGASGAHTNATTIRHSQDRKKQKQRGLVRPNKATSSQKPSSGNADLDAAIERFGIHGFKEEAWLHEFLQQHSVIELQGECDKLERWIDVIKDGLRGAVLEQYEYFVEASREMSTMGREVAWIRSLVERQQETLMSMRNIDFGNGLEELEEYGIVGEDEFDYEDDEDGLLDGEGNDGISDASSVFSSSSEEQSGPMMSSRTPMRTNLRNPRRRESSRQKASGVLPMARLDDDDGPHPSGSGSAHPSHIEIPSWITDVCEEISAFIKESRYTDATELILKAKAEVSGILSAHEQPTPPVVTTPTSSYNTTRNIMSASNLSSATTGGDGGSGTTRKVLHKKQQALLHRTNTQLDTLMERMSGRLAENLRRKNEALKVSAKRERADPLSTLASLVSPVCLNDDAIALNLLVKLGRYQEAATAYAARRSLLLSECLHERPISSPVGMDAVIYAAQISSSFFSSLAIAVEGFLDLFIDSNADSSGNDDDTSLNSRSLALGTGGKRVPSGALSAIVLWCDSELVKFTNAFGSSRLLGSLALSPPGIRRPVSLESSKNSLAKEREHSIEVAAKCINQAFAYASENLDTIGLSLTPKLAENMRPKLKGCEAEVAAFLDVRWKAVTFDWVMEGNVPEMNNSIPMIRPLVSPRPLADDRRV